MFSFLKCYHGIFRLISFHFSWIFKILWNHHKYFPNIKNHFSEITSCLLCFMFTELEINCEGDVRYSKYIKIYFFLNQRWNIKLTFDFHSATSIFTMMACSAEWHSSYAILSCKLTYQLVDDVKKYYK